jgi:hypothetical protein
MKMIRLAVATAGVVSVALLLVAAASAKPPAPPTNVACGQDALVAAINAANLAGGGTLNLAHECDYQLTSSPDDSENGLPAITTAIKINGNRATIDGTDSFRDFEVDGPGGSLSAHDLTVTGGSVGDFGGGIANLGGTVTLERVQVTGNSAGLAGGGIANATFDPSSVATLTLDHSSVSDNQQTLDGNDGGFGGGGIFNADGTVSLDHSWANVNTAQGFLGGGGIATGDFLGGGATVLNVDHSQVNGNTAPNSGGGGGIQNTLGSVSVDHSQVDRNTSLNGGGIASGNQGGPGTAELNVSHSEVNGNTATGGPGQSPQPVAAGGIANGSNAVIDHSQVDDNMAPNGPGAGIVNHGPMTITHSEVNRNTAAASGFAGSGGGILNIAPSTVLNIEHSKIDDNSAGGFGGGIANGAGPIPAGDVNLTHSEVRRNSAAHGGGIYNNGGNVTLSHSKIDGNTPDNCEPTNSIAGCTN